jgi:hypothetical protein
MISEGRIGNEPLYVLIQADVAVYLSLDEAVESSTQGASLRIEGRLRQPACQLVE